MPTYEYQCKTCGHQFEQTQRFSDPPLTECPKCSGAVRRMIFPAGVIFKGSGWYITDSRKSSADARTVRRMNRFALDMSLYLAPGRFRNRSRGSPGDFAAGITAPPW